MIKATKMALQLVGLAAWGIFWIGGSMVLLKKATDKEKAQLKKERDEREARKKSVDSRES